LKSYNIPCPISLSDLFFEIGHRTQYFSHERATGEWASTEAHAASGPEQSPSAPQAMQLTGEKDHHAWARNSVY
jgi:hypothetical protein